jgi:hypothetical protein
MIIKKFEYRETNVVNEIKYYYEKLYENVHVTFIEQLP